MKEQIKYVRRGIFATGLKKSAKEKEKFYSEELSM